MQSSWNQVACFDELINNVSEDIDKAEIFIHFIDADLNIFQACGIHLCFWSNEHENAIQDNLSFGEIW